MLGMSTLMAPSAGAQQVDVEVTTTVEGFNPGDVYPGVTWGANGYSVHGSGDRTSGCDLDWQAAAILDSRLDDYQNNGFTLKVEGETGYSALQHFYTPGGEAVWRPVVAFAADVTDATVVLTLPATVDATDYAVADASTWLVDNYFPAVEESRFTTSLTYESITQTTVDDTTTVTISLGDVEAGSAFSAELTGDVGGAPVEGSVRTTGTFTNEDDCKVIDGGSAGDLTGSAELLDGSSALLEGSSVEGEAGSGEGSAIDGSAEAAGSAALGGSAALLGGSSALIGSSALGSAALGSSALGSALPGSSVEGDVDGEGSALPGSSVDGAVNGRGGSSDARCVQAAATVGIPLLALLPIGLATQMHIPGLSPLVADAQAQLQAVNTDLQQQSGIHDETTANFMAQVNAELQKHGTTVGQAVGAAALIAIGGLAGKHIYDNCVPRG